MRERKYLNVILTVNAVLLACLLWTQVASEPVFEETATAEPQSRSRRQERTRPIGALPNATEQRLEIVRALREMKRAIDAQGELLESGKVKVEVTNLDEIDLEISD
jgi:hypothetical protein